MPNDINKLRRLMFSANYLRKTKPVILRGASLDKGTALHYAWWFESFRDQLRSGIYRFSYFKKDGSIREARGTLDFDYIPEQHRPKSLSAASDESPKNHETFAYFDLDAQGWRSFRLDNFIGFVEPLRDSDIPGCRDT